MAENGSAGNVFRDRRGENPFKPVVPSGMKPRSMADQAARAGRAYSDRPERPIEDYNGQGSSTPNGSALPSYLNGFQISRESPDTKKRFDTEIRLGIRREREA